MVVMIVFKFSMKTIVYSKMKEQETVGLKVDTWSSLRWVEITSGFSWVTQEYNIDDSFWRVLFLWEKKKKIDLKKKVFFLYNVLALILAHPLLNIINDHEVLPVIDLWLWPNCKTKSDHGVLEIWPKSPKQNAKALAFWTNNHWQSTT